MAFEGAIEVKHEAIKPMLSEAPLGASMVALRGYCHGYMPVLGRRLIYDYSSQNCLGRGLGEEQIWVSYNSSMKTHGYPIASQMFRRDTRGTRWR